MEAARSADPGLYRRNAGEFEAAYLSALDLWDRGDLAGALAALRANERDHGAGALFAAVRREAEASLGFRGARDEGRGAFAGVFGRGGQSAVARETAVRRVPDPAGEEIARFPEGLPVSVVRGAGGPDGRGWALVTSRDADGITGWIPGENIITY
jgi:hypothetical protein